jgi:hypothetical protein
MRLADARIGYAGYSRDFSGPGDRRRFCAYAGHRGLGFERARLDRDYDLVLVTHNGDIPGWTDFNQHDPGQTIFVFELADSYLTQTGLVRRFLKGVARYALGVDSRFSPDFLKTLIRACECADVVICSTDEQAAMIRRYTPKVVTSFDYFGGDLGPPKEDYRRSGKLRLVWEGQSTTLSNIRILRDVLNDLRDRVELHVVTDPLVYRYFGRFLPHASRDLLKGFKCDVHFHPWDRTTFSTDITAADVAIIPIDGTNRFAMGKPENKLVMLWQLGMPVLASPTPAYTRTMGRAGIDMLCATSADWRVQLGRLIEAGPAELEAIGRRGRAFAEHAYSRDAFDACFDRAFAAAGLSVSS